MNDNPSVKAWEAAKVHPGNIYAALKSEGDKLVEVIIQQDKFIEKLKYDNQILTNQRDNLRRDLEDYIRHGSDFQ